MHKSGTELPPLASSDWWVVSGLLLRLTDPTEIMNILQHLQTNAQSVCERRSRTIFLQLS